MIGLQLYSVKELTERDLVSTLEMVANAGYEGVEFAGFGGCEVRELKEKLTELGLKPIGNHVPIEALETRLEQEIEKSLEMGMPYMVCPGLRLKDHKDYKKTADLLNQIGERCTAIGIAFGFHNHGQEFQLNNSIAGMDILLGETDPNHVFFELDIFWAEVAKRSAVEMIKAQPERFPLLHIKDLKSKDDKISTEVGNGILDVESIIRAGKTHADWYIIEQEDFEKDPIQSVTESCSYMKRILKEVLK